MSNKQRLEPWRNAERHHCAACNSWMGSDRQSILLHENGRKHKEAVEMALQQKRDDRVAQNQAATHLQRTLAAMTEAAVSSHISQDVGQYYGASALDSVAAAAAVSAATTTAATKNRPTTPVQKQQTKGQVQPAVVNKNQVNEEKAAWASRKQMRDEEKKRKKEGSDDDEEADAEDAARDAKRLKQQQRQRQLAPDDGNYTLDDNNVYLEGVTFVDLLEDDMPIQIWLGPNGASLEEKRLPHHQNHWCNGLIVRIRRSSQEKETGKVLDVAHLQPQKDGEEETLEKSVPPNRIRLLLGSDPSIPDTLQEARIAATGGHVVTIVPAAVAADANTGLSTWGTIEIRQTTLRQEVKQDRERLRQARRDEIKRLDESQRTVEGRRMEEARVDNAEDSALGAYDVWNTAGQTGYKGVNIHATEKMTAADAAGSTLSGGKKVEFKKKSTFKKRGKKQNRRTTSADDL